MDIAKLRLKPGRNGFLEMRWSEKQPDGVWRSRTASTRTKDRAIAQAVMKAFGEQEQQTAARAQGKTIGELLTLYQASAHARGVAKSQDYAIAALRQHFEHCMVDDLQPQSFLDYATARGVAGPTVRRELSALRATLNWCDKHNFITGRVPNIDLPAPGPARAVCLSEADAADLFALAAADRGRDGRVSRVGRFVCIGLETGARKEAIETLTWDRVHFDVGLIDFRDPTRRETKKKRACTPMTDALLAVLRTAHKERLAGAASNYVLDSLGEIKKPFVAFVARHGFTNVTPHVLRHTRVTLLLRAGVEVWDVSKLVGLSVALIEAVYGHHKRDERLRALANRRYQPDEERTAA